MPLSNAFRVTFYSSPETRAWLWHLAMYVVCPLEADEAETEAWRWCGDYTGPAAYHRSGGPVAMHGLDFTRPAAGAVRQTLDAGFFNRARRAPIAMNGEWIVRVDEEVPALLTFTTAQDTTQLSLDLHERLLDTPWVMSEIVALPKVIGWMTPQAQITIGPEVERRCRTARVSWTSPEPDMVRWLRGMTKAFRHENRVSPLSPRAERDRDWLKQSVQWRMDEALRRDPTVKDRKWGEIDPTWAELERILAAVLAPPGQDPPGFGPQLHYPHFFSK